MSVESSWLFETNTKQSFIPLFTLPSLSSILRRLFRDIQQCVMNALSPLIQHPCHRLHLFLIQHLPFTGHLDPHSRLQPREHDLFLQRVNAAFEQSQSRSMDQKRLDLPSHPLTGPTSPSSTRHTAWISSNRSTRSPVGRANTASSTASSATFSSTPFSFPLKLPYP